MKILYDYRMKNRHEIELKDFINNRYWNGFLSYHNIGIKIEYLTPETLMTKKYILIPRKDNPK